MAFASESSKLPETMVLETRPEMTLAHKTLPGSHTRFYHHPPCFGTDERVIGGGLGKMSSGGHRFFFFCFSYIPPHSRRKGNDLCNVMIVLNDYCFDVSANHLKQVGL